MSENKLLITKPSEDYELLDSGEGLKLERFGLNVISRPDPQALWDKGSKNLWQKIDASFNTKWHTEKSLKGDWRINLCDNTFILKLSAFKHVGVFPEQESNWKWMDEKIRTESSIVKKEINVLNLFGYTGGATMACLKAGARVTHVDGSKSAITWAKANAEASKLAGKPVRWILDDATTFVKREIRRNVKYDAIILDPPSFGRGPKGEPWKIEKDLPGLIHLLREIVSDSPLFVLMNGYASGYSPITYENSLDWFKKTFGGVMTSGELGIEESGGERILPAGIFARWQRHV